MFFVFYIKRQDKKTVKCRDCFMTFLNAIRNGYTIRINIIKYLKGFNFKKYYESGE